MRLIAGASLNSVLARLRVVLVPHCLCDVCEPGGALVFPALCRVCFWVGVLSGIVRQASKQEKTPEGKTPEGFDSVVSA